MDLQGRYVDKSLKLFFDKNMYGEVVFPKCNCEGSEKPSVLSMWGSCFSVFNAIERDIKSSQNSSIQPYNDQKIKISSLIKQGQIAAQNLKYKEAQDYFNNAIEIQRGLQIKHPYFLADYRPYYYLGELHYTGQFNFEHALSCYNNAINILSQTILTRYDFDLTRVRDDYNKYMRSKEDSKIYDEEVRQRNSLPFFEKLFTDPPIKPRHYNFYKTYEKEAAAYENMLLVAEMFTKMAEICTDKEEYYPAEICELAADDIQRCTKRGIDVLKLRSEGVQYIGGLYNEIEPY